MCWTEELAGKAENTLLFSEELDFWVDWMNKAEENNDIRFLIGAFENDKMLGIIYNHHYSSSNQFYLKFGAEVVRQDQQMNSRLLVDVFLMDMLSMKRNIEKSLLGYVLI